MNKGLLFITAFSFTVIMLKGFIVETSASEELDCAIFEDLLGDLALLKMEAPEDSETSANDHGVSKLHESNRQSPAPESPKETQSSASPRSDSDEAPQPTSAVAKPSFTTVRQNGPRAQSPRTSSNFLTRTSRSQSTNSTSSTRGRSQSSHFPISPRVESPRNSHKTHASIIESLRELNDGSWEIDFLMGYILPRSTNFTVGNSDEPLQIEVKPPLEGAVLFFKLENCIAYERPENTVLGQLRTLDKTNYDDPEVIIDLAGITDEKLQWNIRLYFKDFNSSETIIKLSGTKDEKLIKRIRKYFETKDQVLKKKKFSELRNKIKEKTQKIDVKAYVEKVIVENTLNIQEKEQVKAIISHLKTRWVTFSKEHTGVMKPSIEPAKRLAAKQHLNVERFGANAPRIFPTVYEPLQDSMVYLFPRLREHGATLVLYGDYPYNPSIGQFMGDTGFIREGALPEQFYCHTTDPNKSLEILHFLEPQPSRITFVGDTIERLSTDRQTVHRFLEEKGRADIVVDTFLYNPFASSISAHLLVLQYELMAEWKKKFDPTRELIY